MQCLQGFHQCSNIGQHHCCPCTSLQPWCIELCFYCLYGASKVGVLTCLVSLLSLSTSTSAANSTASLTRKPESASNSVVSVRNSRQPQSLAAREYLFCDSLDTDLQPSRGLSS